MKMIKSGDTLLTIKLMFSKKQVWLKMLQNGEISA
jgi:hypothetical protein